MTCVGGNSPVNLQVHPAREPEGRTAKAGDSISFCSQGGHSVRLTADCRSSGGPVAPLTWPLEAYV